jgi:hypothetical protein
VPEIEYVAESDWMGQHGLVVGDKKLYLMEARLVLTFENIQVSC